VAATLGLDAGPESQWPALLALQLFSGTGENQAEPLIKRYLAGAQAKPEIQLDYVRALLERGRRADAKTELTSLVARWPQYLDGWLLRACWPPTTGTTTRPSSRSSTIWTCWTRRPSNPVTCAPPAATRPS
jgi:predicted Zn-dependent protease